MENRKKRAVFVISSFMRNKVNKISSTIIGRGKLQKSLVICYYNLKAATDFRQETKKALNYKAVINGKRNFHMDEFYRGNGMYGIGKVLREYCGYQEKINACIEHGLYFGEHYSEFEVHNSGLNGIITFSSKRREVLEKTADVPVLPIGPYIKYAKAMISVESVKKEIGRTLLVFPVHSVDRVETTYNERQFMDWIDELAVEKSFDTVIVCLYYKDILMGRDVIYKNRGYKVVTAGYQFDPCFLGRLRTFIELSDFTVSNSAGTHVGYCVSLGKGHMIYGQRIGYDAYTPADIENENLEDFETRKDEDTIKEAFRGYYEKPSQEQLDIVEHWWGLSHFKCRKDMYRLLSGFESNTF